MDKGGDAAVGDADVDRESIALDVGVKRELNNLTQTNKAKHFSALSR